MATEDTNVDCQITNGEIEKTTAETKLENAAEDNSEAQVCASAEPVSELHKNIPKSVTAELKEPTENLSETQKPENPSQTVIEEERKGENSSEVDTKATENVESSTGDITDTAQSSTTPLPEENKQTDEEKKSLEQRRRGRRAGKGVLVRKLASLNLPDGVILVQDRQYTGYHCTYCNCVLRSLATVKAHVYGKWHKRTLQIRESNDGKKAKVATPSKSAPKAPPLPKVPLKSSLEEYLSTVNTTIVGLSYIVETQRPDKKPTFQCNLCEISCDTANVKDHINGIKHCLMYLKLVKPTQLAELLAKQLSKAEKNKEITKLAEELQKENGRGEIVVKAAEEKETASKLPRNQPLNRFQRAGSKFSNRSREGRAGNWFSNRPQATGNRSNRPVARTANVNQRNRNPREARRGNIQMPSQQKRKNEGISPAKKRQLLEREFQARVQYSRERAQNNFFSGRWGMGSHSMNMDFYPDYPNFYPDPYNERRRMNRQQYMNESYEQMSQFPERERYRRERYEDRQSSWNDRRDSFASNNPRNYPSMLNTEHSRKSHVHLSALKQLAGLNVTSDEDAGVVVNAINSLTNSFMNYKLRDLSGPVQQLLQKSLKSSDLKSLLDVPARNVGNTGTRNRYEGRSSQDRYEGRPSQDRYEGRSSQDRYEGRSSQMNRDWGISQIAKPKNWLF